MAPPAPPGLPQGLLRWPGPERSYAGGTQLTTPSTGRPCRSCGCETYLSSLVLVAAINVVFLLRGHLGC